MNKFFVLACLYTAQTIPGHFASNAMPVIMRHENYSLASIGLIGLIGLPWAFKFLWAPLVDRYGGRKNHYRKWVIPMQALFALLSLAAGFFSIQSDLVILVALMTLSYAFAATQDIAVDAWAVKTLDHAERGLGNGIQSGGNVLGAVLGSSVALILYLHTSWAFTLAAQAAVVLLMGIPILLSSEAPQPPAKPASYRDIISFFRIPGMARICPVILVAFGGMFSSMNMCKPLLVDLGHDWYFISLIMGGLPVAGIPVALLCGLAIRKWGRKKILIVCCFLCVAACLALIPVASGWGGKIFLYLSLGGVCSIFAALMTVLNTLAMDFARPGRGGSDFTMFISLSFFGGMICMGLSGLVAQRFGYEALFAGCAGLYVLLLVLLLWLYRGRREFNG